MKHFITFSLLVLAKSSLACTGVEIGAGANVTIGQNVGWFWQLDAAIVVNKRSMSKYGIGAAANETPARWVAKYGSVTLNPMGREFPLSGVNEKGLSVQGLHSYDGPYDSGNSTPVLNVVQWIQYQLDVSANLEEAIANAQLVRPANNPVLTLHYMICEASGRCAIFEWINQKLVVHKEDDLVVRAYTNSDYATSASAYLACANQSCPLPEDGPNFSLKRFVVASRLAKAYDGVGDPMAYMLTLLERVIQNKILTAWSVIIRQNGGAPTIHFSDPGSFVTQFVDLRDLDFSCAQPAQVQLVDFSATGNIVGSFKPYDVNLQKQLVAGTRLPEQKQNVLVEYPDKTVCVP